MTSKRAAALPQKKSAQKSKVRTFDAFPDRIDVRDWPYQPTLAPLPNELVPARKPHEKLNRP